MYHDLARGGAGWGSYLYILRHQHLVPSAIAISVYTKATHFMYNLIPEQQTMTRNIISTSRCSPYKSDQGPYSIKGLLMIDFFSKNEAE